VWTPSNWRSPNLCTTCCCSTLVHPLYHHQERGAPVPRPSGAHGRVALRDLALRHWLLLGDGRRREGTRTRRRYVEPSRRLTCPPCVCSRGTNHMPNVKQAPVPSEPHPHHFILCTCSCVSQSDRSPCRGLRASIS